MTAYQLGYEYSIVLGHSNYYPKAGYVPASQYGIKAPFEVEDENFMAVSLSWNKNKLNGIMEYDKAFGIWCSVHAIKLRMKIEIRIEFDMGVDLYEKVDNIDFSSRFSLRGSRLQ